MNELLAVWKGSSFLCVVEAGVEAEPRGQRCGVELKKNQKNQTLHIED